ncbi:MAG: AAA family ATPase, partial [Myxococcota bacterium]|nr:AAA family ATPase [Myxococcota bacterium]
MRVHAIALTNIKNYRGTTAFERLAPGLLLLLGRNGCGKSTLPQAVGLSVFGAIPAEFKNSAGKGLVGFVNRQETSGAIRVVVELRPGRVLTFDTTLKVLPLKGEQLDPSNEVRTSVYEGIQPLEGPLPRARALQQALPIASVAALVQQELGVTERGDALYGTLLSPSQSGGLTAYLSETPRRRQDQTERILGLQTVKKVGEVLRKLCQVRKTQAEVLEDQLRSALTAAAERHDALMSVLHTHGGTDVPFEALTEGELRAAGTLVRNGLVAAVIEEARAVITAHRTVEAANARATRLGASSAAAKRLVEALTARDTAQKEVAEGEAAVRTAAKLADDAEKWRAANEQVDALTKAQTERNKATAAIERAVAEARKDVERLDTEAGARTAERERHAAESAQREAALDLKLQSFADFDARQRCNATEIASLDAGRIDLGVLRELLAACADIGDLDAPQDKLARLHDALGQGRLPEDAEGLVDAVAAQLASIGEPDTQATASAFDQLDTWDALNTAARDAARQVERALTREKADVETARKTAEDATKRRGERQETLDREDAAGRVRRAEIQEVIAQRQSALTELAEAHEGLDDDLARAQRLMGEGGTERLPLEAQAWILPILHAKGDHDAVDAILRHLDNR